LAAPNFTFERTAGRVARPLAAERVRSRDMSGMEHSPTSATGTAWERTPWHATQRAA